METEQEKISREHYEHPQVIFDPPLDKHYGDKKKLPTDDPVNHPSHYTSHPSGVECITITKHMSFCLGNAIKYIWRQGEKGSREQDVQKAIWYLNQELELIRAQKKPPIEDGQPVCTGE